MEGLLRVILLLVMWPVRKVSVASPPAVLFSVTPEFQVMVPTTSLSTLVPVLSVVR